MYIKTVHFVLGISHESGFQYKLMMLQLYKVRRMTQAKMSVLAGLHFFLESLGKSLFPLGWIIYWLSGVGLRF